MLNDTLKKSRILMLVCLLFIIPLLISCSLPKSKSIDEKKEDDIAQLHIFTYDGKNESKNLIASLGHTFLMMVNISDKPINVGSFILDIDSSVTFSWWAIDRHMGVWYDIESCYIVQENRYETRYSVYQYINQDDLQKINEYIDENDTYSPLKNCSKNCSNVWNICAGPNEAISNYLICTPSKVLKELKLFSTVEYCHPAYTRFNVTYYNSNNESFVME